MKLVEQSAEYIIQKSGIEGVYEHIEKCSRVCYKSEDRMSENPKDFVDKLIKNGHTAMLEHGTVYLKCESSPDCKLNKFLANPYSSITFEHFNKELCFVTTNFRVLYENDWIHDLRFLCEPFESYEKRYTMKLVTSIGIVRELLRHRKFSFANESTRFCNYNKDRFGNELVFVKPFWFYDCQEPVRMSFCSMLSYIEDFYKDATNGKIHTIVQDFHNSYKKMDHLTIPLTAQQAREILPLCTKSEIVMTGFEDDWKHFFDLRLYGKTGKPHPDMVVLAQKIKDEFERNGINF